MKNKIYTLVVALFISSSLFSQYIEYKKDKQYKSMDASWKVFLSNEYTREIGIKCIKVKTNKNVLHSFTPMLKSYHNKYSINGYRYDTLSINYVTYGKIKFESYKRDTLIFRQVYLAVLDLAYGPALMLFTDLEEENDFFGLYLDNFSVSNNDFYFKHDELGEYRFRKK